MSFQNKKESYFWTMNRRHWCTRVSCTSAHAGSGAPEPSNVDTQAVVVPHEHLARTYFLSWMCPSTLWSSFPNNPHGLKWSTHLCPVLWEKQTQVSAARQQTAGKGNSVTGEARWRPLGQAGGDCKWVWWAFGAMEVFETGCGDGSMIRSIY